MLDLEQGVVRAYDARTGALRWTFDPIPRSPDHPAWDAWTPEAPGEEAWSTQPFPVHTPPLHEATLTADSAFGLTDEDRTFCREWIRSLRNDGIFTPPSLHGTLQWPGFAGGMNLDGMGWDPERRILVTTFKRLALYVRLHPRDEFASAQEAARPEMGFTSQSGIPTA